MNDSESGNKAQQNGEVVKNTGQFIQHIAYWYSDGSIVVRVDNQTIYKIHLSMLTKLSKVTEEILTIPDNKRSDDPNREGTSLYPLFIPGTNAQEFNDFLFWLYLTEWESLGDDVEKERMCTHLLKLADMWEIAAAKKYAIHALDMVYLSPSRRLELAGKFAIPDWVRPAVRRILDGKLSQLKDDDICAMGWKVYSMLVNAMEMLGEETRRTALVPPGMIKDPSIQCTDHTSCQSIWPKLWFDKIGRDLLHPKTPMKLGGIVAKILQDATLTHPKLSECCRLDMVLHCSRIIFADEDIVTQVPNAIIQFHATLA
ncbi:hypothetical protein R3P38DRAFT_2527283 [Favolaschia claudopus]|uniref:BTB domain-containing protein n=1 Tax=Favolaschia claudopus TaxID=2862362 RepID=A0AAW0BKT6_9AGAR